MKIGILQTGHVADEIRSMLGDYSDMFVRLLNGHGFDFVVYNVVEQHNGTIEIDSTPGEGTTVAVRLPRTAPSA